MSDAKTEKTPAGTQLARLDPETQERIAKLLMRRQSTTGKRMEIKRRELAETTLAVEVLIEKLNAPDADPTSPEYLKILNTVNCMTALATVKGLEYLCDCNSYREQVWVVDKKTKTKERGYSRLTVADALYNMVQMIAQPGGLHDNTDIILEMLNDIGNEMKAFKDEHGVHDPKKYDAEEKSSGEAECDEDSAATDRDLEEVEATVKAKTKVKGVK